MHSQSLPMGPLSSEPLDAADAGLQPIGARTTLHSEQRVVERLKISAAHLTDLLAAQAYVRLEGSKVNPEAEARLVWSPPDKDFVLVWQNIHTGAIITCMLFTGSTLERRLLVYWGGTSLQRACSRARKRCTRWLLQTQSFGSPDEDSGLPSLDEGTSLDWSAGVQEEPVVEQPKKSRQPMALELHFPFGLREKVLFSELPQDFVAKHPVRSQREAWLFIAELLSSEWLAGFLNEWLKSTRWSLEQLKTLSIQRQRHLGSTMPRVSPEKTLLDCVLEDLEEGRRLYEACSVFDWSLHSPLATEHPFFHSES